MADFLDTNGLRLLWTKIKARFLTDVTVNGTSVVSGGIAALPLLPDANTTPKVITVQTSITNITTEQLESLRVGDIVKVEGSSIDSTYTVLSANSTAIHMVYSFESNNFFQFIHWSKQTNDTWTYRINPATLYLPTATSGNLAGFDSNKNIVDSGIDASSIVTQSDISGKADKVSTPTFINTTAINGLTSAQCEAMRVGDVVNQGGVNAFYCVGKQAAELYLWWCDWGNEDVAKVVYKKSGGIWSFTSVEKIPTQTHREGSQPTNGMLPNVFYAYGIISTNKTFKLDDTIASTTAKTWHWSFYIGSTVPNITWPTSYISNWAGGAAPVIKANTRYEVVVMENFGICYSSDNAMSAKADKVANPTSGNLAMLDANGNLTDSGYSPLDFANLSSTPQTIGVTDITALSNNQVTSLRIGDLVILNDNGTYYTYSVSKKNESIGTCSLVYSSYDKIEEVLYERVDNVYSYIQTRQRQF